MNYIEKSEDHIVDAIYIIMINDSKWLSKNMTKFYEDVKNIIQSVRRTDMKSNQFGDKQRLFYYIENNLTINDLKKIIIKAESIQNAKTQDQYIKDIGQHLAKYF